MNGQLPPIDSDLREQLARRSAGRLPEGLLAEVSAALDGVREPRARARWPRLIWSVPRLVGAGMGVALVAILAVAIAFPAFHTGPAASPAGYPTDRALTTDELARLMAGPPLATNTTLVASVTIDVRTDVCPMNRYPTVGVVEGMGSQVCVMGATLAAELAGPTATGVFAFRFIASGYLGLLGEITPVSDSRLAFGAADDWPLNGQPFLVEGWLGASVTAGVCVSTGSAGYGDPLDPTGSDCPYWDWLSDVASPPPATSRGPIEAAGARHFDSIDVAAPVHGVFVVRGITICNKIQDNAACSAWQVLAKVAGIPLAESSPAPASPTPTLAIVPVATPVASPSASFAPAPAGLIGPDDRALAPAELTALIAADPSHLSGRYVIDKRVTCDGTDCSGVTPKSLADVIRPDGSIAVVGPVDLRPDGGLVWTVPQALAAYQDRFIFIVDAWMFADGQSAWLDSDATAELTAQDGAFSQFAPAGTLAGTAVHGLFLVQKVNPAKTCGPNPTASSGDCSPIVDILARLEVAAP